MSTLAIDPGKTDSLAVALGRTGLERGTLLEMPGRMPLGQRCWKLARDLEEWVGATVVTAVVVEQMWHRPGSGAAAAAKSIKILELQAIGAYLAGRIGAPVYFYPPHEWKGNVPKEVCHARLMTTGMNHFERLALDAACRPWGKRSHNVKDAAALLHFHLGRYR